MKVSIIGCGLIGMKRAEALSEDIQLIGCYDVDQERCNVFAKKFNIRAFDSLDALFSFQNLDFVIIATRHDSLAEISIQSIEAGVNVFVEKPGAINYQEFKNVIHNAEKKNIKIHIGFNHQYHPAIVEARKIIANGEIGDLMFLRGMYGHGGRAGYEKEWRADKAKSGGGELIDQGSHLLDLSLGFLGNLSLDYAAIPSYFWDMPVEDNAFISLKNDSGNIAFLHASCTEWKNMFSLEIYGKSGKIHVSGLGRSYGTETLTLHKMSPEMGPPISNTWEYKETDNSWRIELEEFSNDLIKGSSISDNRSSSLEVLRLIGEIYQRSGK
jgi:predicted dehydrogenase